MTIRLSLLVHRARLSLRERTPSLRRVRAIASLTLAAPSLYSAAQAKTFDLTTATVADINEAMDAGALSSEKLIQMYLKRIEAYDAAGPKIHAIVSLNEQALEQAKALDVERQASGPRSPLHGIPVVLKDLIDAKGLPTSCGFKPFGLPLPPRSATVVQRLEDAGAIILAKVTTVNWFGRGYDETFYLEPTKNPYNLAYDCGATSAGSGGAIAANFATIALGTDTSQSVQNPAARTLTVGMVGTFGMVSRAGVMPRSAWHDRVGPMAKSVADVAVTFSVISGWDAEDLTTSEALGHHPIQDWSALLDQRELKGVRLGVLREMFYEDVPEHAEGLALFDKALSDLKAAGAFIVDPVLSGMDLKEMTTSQYLRLAEFEKLPHSNAYLARYGDAIPFKTMEELMEKHRDAFSPRMIEALDLPSPDQSVEYEKRLAACLKLRAMLNGLLDKYKLDGFVIPFSAVGPSLLSGDGPRIPGSGNSLGSYASLPAVVVPGGLTATDNLPIGIQFIGGSYQDLKILQIANAYEQVSKNRILPATTPALPGETFDY